MSKRLGMTCFSVCLVYVVVSFVSSEALERSYVEDFTTQQYCDTLNTTAWWDTVGAELKLYSFQPSLVVHLDTPGSAHWAVLAGDYAYVADYTEGFLVVDVSDPMNPTAVASVDTPGAAHYVALAGDYAYVADATGGLRVIDVSDPTNPIEVASLGTSGSAVAVTLAGDYAYVAAQS
ncbi:MAG: hypothetical protein ABIJ00_05425, partial [Candidatus Eisenbacteria bacterium]